MDERTQQIIEDSERIRDRNRDLESELHGLKVENERLREENEAMFATQGGADPQTFRDALKWLHDQGGIGAVYSLYKDVILGEAEEALEVLYSEDIEKRLMPEGMEWPRFEDGELVKFGDMALIYGEVDMIEAVQLWIHGKPVIYGDCGSQQLERGERVKRPAPKVPDADGMETRAGDTVYEVEGTGHVYKVVGVRVGDGDPLAPTVVTCDVGDGTSEHFLPSQLTHQRPVLDAGGVPIKLGDDLYSVEGCLKLHVSNIDRVNCRIAASAMFALDKWADPSMFTHAKPEPLDTYAKLYEDVHDERCGSEEFVRRCKALAGVTE